MLIYSGSRVLQLWQISKYNTWNFRSHLAMMWHNNCCLVMFILIQRNQNHHAFPQLHGCSFVEKHSQRNLQRNDLIVDDIRENYAFAMIETNFVQTSVASSDSSNQHPTNLTNLTVSKEHRARWRTRSQTWTNGNQRSKKFQTQQGFSNAWFLHS